MRTQSFTANGVVYKMPQAPTLALVIDGGSPEYLNHALNSNHMPNLARMIFNSGRLQCARATMPTFTNTNNASIITGSNASQHGISGNYYIDSNGIGKPLNHASHIRCDSVLAKLHAAGARVLSICVKDKLRSLLSAGGTPSLSVEQASSIDELGYDRSSIENYLGKAPTIYDEQISSYALRLALWLHKNTYSFDFLYVTLTDYVQHIAPPGSTLANTLLAHIDRTLAEFLEAGFIIGITADHGMGAKHDVNGHPNISYLGTILSRMDISDYQVVLPIADPYTRHHASLGSLAWIHLKTSIDDIAEALRSSPGIERVLLRHEAAAEFSLPSDRIGDLVICAKEHYVLGDTPEAHDLSALESPLRSHGSQYEQDVPFFISHALNQNYQNKANTVLYNSDLFDFLLNGVSM